ncbi:heavy metal-associated isoprenylated plant protein 34-like [Coffea eugenioides]|uniref:heavy metal-associated isoprenylated plant protein 34-like n=1 Tax=Coffea eugenioides TaxID=49369 RepID=UPI000F610EDC|nr:heavy metal-associated isoprenylated plant protein 34-like [Coffea eugenioides]
MASHAEANCLMRINIRCEACKMKAHEVFSSVVGVYSVRIDPNEGIACFYGEVEPTEFMSAITSFNNRHGQLVHANVKHPEINSDGSRNSGPGYSYGYPCYGYTYGRIHPTAAYPHRRVYRLHRPIGLIPPPTYMPELPRRHRKGSFKCFGMW